MRTSAIRLAGPPLAAAHEYREVFGLLPQFDDTDSVIVLPAEDLDRDLPDRGFAGLAPILDQEIRRLADAGGREEIAASVRRAIARALPAGPPSLTALARRLGLSTRTLQRRLSEHDLTLRGLIDDTRYELARYHLKVSRLRMAEIAFLLGYREPSSFSHAFKRWAGISPAEYRRRGAEGGQR